MKKPNIPNFPVIVIGGAAAVALLSVLIVLIVKLNTMQEPILKLQVSMISPPAIPLNTSSEEEPASEPEGSAPGSSAPESSAPQVSAPAVSTPAVPPPVSSAPPPASSAPPPVSSAPAESGPAESLPEEPPVPSEPEVPARPDGVTRIELLNLTEGKSGDVPFEKFDELLGYLEALNLEFTEETIDSSMVVDARILVYKGESVTAYTVYPIWAINEKVYIEHGGGRELLSYLQTFAVFEDHRFPY